MPRRRAPTALRLHQGPLPTRIDPRHVLPQPPRPSLAPVRPLTRAVAVDLPAPPPAAAQQPFFVQLSIQVSSSAPKKVVGPWDRTVQHFSTTMGAGFSADPAASGGRPSPIAAPKPVVVSVPSPKRTW